MRIHLIRQSSCMITVSRTTSKLIGISQLSRKEESYYLTTLIDWTYMQKDPVFNKVIAKAHSLGIFDILGMYQE
jgi:hypothetical protein